MKALSIKQPWASLIVEGIKDVENRNWFTYYRGLLYIHASKGYDFQGANVLTVNYPEYRSIIEKSKCFRGGIIGSVQMVDCVSQHHSEWFYGKYGFVFRSAQNLKFHSLKGKLNIFNFSFKGEKKPARVETQLSLFD